VRQHHMVVAEMNAEGKVTIPERGMVVGKCRITINTSSRRANERATSMKQDNAELRSPTRTELNRDVRCNAGVGQGAEGNACGTVVGNANATPTSPHRPRRCEMVSRVTPRGVPRSKLRIFWDGDPHIVARVSPHVLAENRGGCFGKRDGRPHDFWMVG
jgi:hypothetical protein